LRSSQDLTLGTGSLDARLACHAQARAPSPARGVVTLNPSVGAERKEWLQDYISHSSAEERELLARLQRVAPAGGAGRTACRALLPQLASLAGLRGASDLLAPGMDAGAEVEGFLAELRQAEPVAPTFEVADLASGAASAAASSTCAPAPGSGTAPAGTGAPLWAPGDPLCALWPARPAGPSTSAGASSPAPFDWAASKRRAIKKLEDDARAAARAAPLLPVRSARRTSTRAACAVLAHLWHCIQDHIGYCACTRVYYRVIYAPDIIGFDIPCHPALSMPGHPCISSTLGQIDI